MISWRLYLSQDWNIEVLINNSISNTLPKKMEREMQGLTSTLEMAWDGPSTALDDSNSSIHINKGGHLRCDYWANTADPGDSQSLAAIGRRRIHIHHRLACINQRMPLCFALPRACVHISCHSHPPWAHSCHKHHHQQDINPSSTHCLIWCPFLRFDDV